MKKRILKQLAEVWFESGEHPEIVVPFANLLKAVEDCDFSADSERARPIREKLLAERIFIAEPGKKIFTLELTDGTRITGKFEGYRQASLIFWTADGIIEVPFFKVPADLKSCFPQDVAVIFDKLCGEFTEHVKAATELHQEHVTQWLEKLEDITQAIRSANETIDELRAENSALQMENAELRARLQERE